MHPTHSSSVFSLSELILGILSTYSLTITSLRFACGLLVWGFILYTFSAVYCCVSSSSSEPLELLMCPGSCWGSAAPKHPCHKLDMVVYSQGYIHHDLQCWSPAIGLFHGWDTCNDSLTLFFGHFVQFVLILVLEYVFKLFISHDYIHIEYTS